MEWLNMQVTTCEIKTTLFSIGGLKTQKKKIQEIARDTYNLL